jgi:hypothetical protein
MGGPELQRMGALGDPGRMLEDAAEGLDEGGAVHLRGARAADGGWVARPVLGDLRRVANQTPSWARM